MPFVKHILDVLAPTLMGAAEVLRVDVLQRQKAPPLWAEIHEGGLQAWFDADDLRLVDVALHPFPATVLDVEIMQLLAVHQGHAQFFGLGGVD